MSEVLPCLAVHPALRGHDCAIGDNDRVGCVLPRGHEGDHCWDPGEDDEP